MKSVMKGLATKKEIERQERANNHLVEQQEIMLKQESKVGLPLTLSPNNYGYDQNILSNYNSGMKTRGSSQRTTPGNVQHYVDPIYDAKAMNTFKQIHSPYTQQHDLNGQIGPTKRSKVLKSLQVLGELNGDSINMNESKIQDRIATHLVNKMNKISASEQKSSKSRIQQQQQQ